MLGDGRRQEKLHGNGCVECFFVYTPKRAQIAENVLYLESRNVIVDPAEIARRFYNEPRQYTSAYLGDERREPHRRVHVGESRFLYSRPRRQPKIANSEHAAGHRVPLYRASEPLEPINLFVQ